MTRKKVKLAFIANDLARKATYKKRKRGLLKKMDELTTLCDVKTCVVLYSPYESKPVVWPGSSGARDVISSFKRLPEMEKVKKMVSQEEFLRQRVVKAHEQLKRQQKENREKEMTQVMYQCLMGNKSIQNMSLLDLSDLAWVINQHLNEINMRREGLRRENSSSNTNNIAPAVTNVTGDKNNDNANVALEGQNWEFEAMQTMMQQPWSSFMDMMSAPIMDDNHNVSQEMGMELDMGMRVEYGGASSSSSSNINMNMMIGQFGNGDGVSHLGHVDPSMWSNKLYQ